jgi:hypothetical protein
VTINTAGRHPATQHLARQFASDHLPASLREVSDRCGHVAYLMILDLPDGPELTAGLRKLLEAKDCFVRHAVDVGAPTDQGGAA